MRNIVCIILLCSITLVSFNSCNRKKDNIQKNEVEIIQDSGKLVVLTLYGATSYFMYRGEEMGFQYELSNQFANYLGVKLKIKIARNIKEMISMLNAGEGDLIAYDLPISNGLKDSIIYCGDEIITHQVLVQQNIKNNKYITDVTQLIGKDIFVKPGKHFDRLQNLNEELGGGINIHLVKEDSISEEDLISQVSLGKIDYTVADRDMASLNKTYLSNLDIHLKISFDQRASWAVRKTNPHLAHVANRWFSSIVKSPEYSASAYRYFSKSKNVSHSTILSLLDGKISLYDSLFKTYSKKIGWDWRLIASIAYIESNFDPQAISWAGALGLMQLMPSTASRFGVQKGHEHDPESSISAATKYISAVEKMFSDIHNPEEKRNFVIASYNSGVGHIKDAMALAEKYGKNKYVWKDNVETYVLLKSHKEYYNDPVCKQGYFRGVETVNFVENVRNRYEAYKNLISE